MALRSIKAVQEAGIAVRQAQDQAATDGKPIAEREAA